MPRERRVVWERIGTQDAAWLLGVSTRTIRRYIVKRILHPKRLPSGHWRFSAQEIRELREGEPPANRGQPRT